MYIASDTEGIPSLYYWVIIRNWASFLKKDGSLDIPAPPFLWWRAYPHYFKCLRKLLNFIKKSDVDRRLYIYEVKNGWTFIPPFRRKYLKIWGDFSYRDKCPRKYINETPYVKNIEL